VDILDIFGLTPAYSFAGAGSKLCLEKQLYFCLESSYNFWQNLQRLGSFFVVGNWWVVEAGGCLRGRQEFPRWWRGVGVRVSRSAYCV